MTLKEFIALITKEQPALEDISEIVEFAENADVEVIWEALQTSGVHTIVVAMLANVLQKKIGAARDKLGMRSNPDGKSLSSMAGNPQQ
jgi:hypothetical protein